MNEVYPNYNRPQMFIAKSKMFVCLPLLGVKPIKRDQRKKRDCHEKIYIIAGVSVGVGADSVVARRRCPSSSSFRFRETRCWRLRWIGLHRRFFRHPGRRLRPRLRFYNNKVRKAGWPRRLSQRFGGDHVSNGQITPSNRSPIWRASAWPAATLEPPRCQRSLSARRVVFNPIDRLPCQPGLLRDPGDPHGLLAQHGSTCSSWTRVKLGFRPKVRSVSISLRVLDTGPLGGLGGFGLDPSELIIKPPVAQKRRGWALSTKRPHTSKRKASG
jgi:hypothetical protein